MNGTGNIMVLNIIGGCEKLEVSQSELNSLIQQYIAALNPTEDTLHSGATTCGICKAASVAASHSGFKISGYAPGVAAREGVLDLNYDRITIIKGAWGDDVAPCIAEFEKLGQEQVLTLSFNGGVITKIFIERLLAKNFKVLLVAGSGRATDELISLHRDKPNVLVAGMHEIDNIHRIILDFKRQARLHSGR
jgi:hypothetical protein